MFNYLFYKTRFHIVLHLIFRLGFSRLVTIFRNAGGYFLKYISVGKAPSILTIQLTYNCNFNCIMCQKCSRDLTVYSGHIPDLPFNDLETMLRNNSKHISVLKITGGEPLMYANFEALIDLLNALNLKYTLLTNGSLLKGDILQKLLKNCVEISISIDSADPEIYSYMRKGGDLNIVRQNIESLNNLKKGRRFPVLNLAATCFTFNIDGLDKLVEFCAELSIPSMSVSEGGYYNTVEITDNHFIKNNKQQIGPAVNKAQLKADELNITLRWNSPVLYFSKGENQLITNRNKVISCVNFFISGIIGPDLSFKVCPLSGEVANLKNKTLEEIWNGEDLKSCRKMILQNEFPPSCRYCLDYNEHYDEGEDYSYIDYQKKTKYWKLESKQAAE